MQGVKITPDAVWPLEKSITDDGKINKLETTVMCVLFGLIIYFLAKHG